MSSRSEIVRTIRVGDLYLLCHIRGRGPLCVAYPGGPGLSAGYLRMPLLERGLTMVYLEPVGTGGSSRLPPGNGYDLDGYADQLSAVIAAFSDVPVLVLGHGHGGLVAQNCALRHPERVSGLVLYSTAPVADDRTRAAAAERLRRYAVANAARVDAEAMIAAYLRPTDRSVHASTARLWEILPAYFADFWRRRPEFTGLLGALLSSPFPAVEADLRAALPSISAPTMIVAGRHDFEFGLEQAELLLSGIPDADLAEFRESGHFAHVEEAERFGHVVLEFARRDSEVSGEHLRPGRTAVLTAGPDAPWW